jgi:hypothetical protein
VGVQVRLAHRLEPDGEIAQAGRGVAHRPLELVDQAPAGGHGLVDGTQEPLPRLRLDRKDVDAEAAQQTNHGGRQPGAGQVMDLVKFGKHIRSGHRSAQYPHEPEHGQGQRDRQCVAFHDVQAELLRTGLAG